MIRSGIIHFGKVFPSLSRARAALLNNKDCRYFFKCLSSYPAHEDKSKLIKNDSRYLYLLQTFSKAGIRCKNIADIVDSNSILFNISGDQMQQNLSTLIEFGFNEETIKVIIKVCPELFYTTKSELSRLLMLWQEVHFGDKLTLEILSKHPQLIRCIGPDITERIRFLLPYFKKLSNVGNLFINVPGVIYENWETLKAKLDYLHLHNIPRNKIANCNALQLDLFEMKARFTFLERAGIYKIIDSSKKNVLSKNPSVRNILCSSDKVFAENIAKLTLVEYEAFFDLYKLEQDGDADELDHFTKEDSRFDEDT